MKYHNSTSVIFWFTVWAHMQKKHYSMYIAIQANQKPYKEFATQNEYLSFATS